MIICLLFLCLHPISTIFITFSSSSYLSCFSSSSSSYCRPVLPSFVPTPHLIFFSDEKSGGSLSSSSSSSSGGRSTKTVGRSRLVPACPSPTFDCEWQVESEVSRRAILVLEVRSGSRQLLNSANVALGDLFTGKCHLVCCVYIYNGCQNT